MDDPAEAIQAVGARARLRRLPLSRDLYADAWAQQAYERGYHTAPATLNRHNRHVNASKSPKRGTKTRKRQSR